MAFSLGSFAGGVSSGLDQGQEMRRKQMEMEATRRMQAARGDAGNYLTQGGGQPQPPQGGGGQPQMLPQPGATPMPSAQAAPPKPPAPAPMGPAGQTPPAPQPGPPKPPMPQPPGPGAGPPAPQGGGPAQPPTQPQDLNQQGLNLIQTIAQGIAAAQPKGYRWKPGELMDALDTVLGAMKNIDPTTKLAAQNALALQRLQISEQEKAADRDSRESIAGDRNATSRANNQDTNATRVTTQGMGDVSREFVGAGHDATSRSNTADRDATSVTNTNARDTTQERDTDARDSTSSANTLVRDRGATGRQDTRNATSRANSQDRIRRPLKAPLGGGAQHTSPPFPATTEGQTATSPNGDKWVVKGGKWVMQ